MGWVDGDRLEKSYTNMIRLYRSGNREYIKYVWRLWMVFGIEIFIREFSNMNGITRQ